MAEAAVRIEFAAVVTGDAHGFLAAVLQRMESGGGDVRRILGSDHAENAALFAQLVPVGVTKGVS
ncbi:hypothetical protein GCM10011494_07470 [Novosphingobium endophyticum]|uniref:Uncharacterized protein n=1 Tax=Novosphingobium endophyticum TaxID=1955250 RepID=A0A916X3B1_9SPHN|nr:hypothetical protein GCM10011494_07470 [Novosphingobium endophyticum]